MKFNKLFETNLTSKIQIKPGCYPIQQKATPIPCHSQPHVKNELDRLIKSGHLERLETVEEDCFVSPVVITVKKDRTVKIAFDNYSRKGQIGNGQPTETQTSTKYSKN